MISVEGAAFLLTSMVSEGPEADAVKVRTRGWAPYRGPHVRKNLAGLDIILTQIWL